MIKVLNTLLIAAAIVCLSISPCRADITGVSTTGFATASLVYLGEVCYTGYGCPYNASVVSDTVTGASSQLYFTYTSPPSGSDSGYNGERLILEVINGTGSTLRTFTFTMAGATFGAPGVLPEQGSYNGATTPPTYTDGPKVGSLNAANTVWTIDLNLTPSQKKDFYIAENYGVGTPGDTTLTTVAPEPGFYSVFVLFMLGLSGLVIAADRRKKA